MRWSGVSELNTESTQMESGLGMTQDALTGRLANKANKKTIAEQDPDFFHLH